jgi:hypothetical protein
VQQSQQPPGHCQLESEPAKNGAPSVKSAAGPVQGFNFFLGSGETLGMGIRVLEARLLNYRTPEMLISEDLAEISQSLRGISKAQADYSWTHSEPFRHHRCFRGACEGSPRSLMCWRHVQQVWRALWVIGDLPHRPQQQQETHRWPRWRRVTPLPSSAPGWRSSPFPSPITSSRWLWCCGCCGRSHDRKKTLRIS